MPDLSDTEIREFQQLLKKIYGKEAETWNINLGILELLEKLLRRSNSCGSSLDLVPRPHFAGGVIKWASKQARDAVLRQFRNKDEHYYTCLKGAAIGMKTRFELASMGM